MKKLIKSSMKAKQMLSLALVCILAISMLSACGTESSTGGEKAEGKGKIVVGGKDFTEQHILAKMTSIYLKEKGYDVEEVGSMGSAVVRQALENKQIDLYWEYTGTALVVYQKKEVETDPDTAYQKVKETDAQNGLAWLNKSDVNNTYAILMRQDKAQELGITTISDLADYVNANSSELKFASNAEFYAREDGLKGLQTHYGFEFPAENVVKMDSGLLYNALRDGQVDVSVGFATDGRIPGFELVVLEDEKFFFPAYNAVPVVRQEVLENDAELSNLLNELADRLDTESMMNLNHAVDVEHKEVPVVAREWLTSKGLIEE